MPSFRTKRPIVIGLAIVTVLLLLMLGLPWLSPVRGVERAMGELVTRLEGSDFEEMAAVIDAGYSDDWGFTKPEAVALAETLRRQFIVCSITHDRHTVEMREDNRHATFSAVIRFNGSGSPIAQAIINQSGQTQTPTRFEWVRRSWKPWDWTLVSLTNPEATRGVKRLQRELGSVMTIPEL